VVRGFAILLALQFVGEMISRGSGIPIPGSVIGMVLLLTALGSGLLKAQWVEEAVELLLSHLALFFIPAGVGVMVHMDLIRREWLPISVAMVVSTFAVMAVTGWVEARLNNRKEGSRVE
jgi:holin-like protein